MSDSWHSLSFKPEPGVIPHAPGVYRFMDASKTVIYVGKAKFLDDRLGSYFRNPESFHPRTKTMVSTATSVKWTVCASEVEALVLEQSWIHQYTPRFNVAMKNSGERYTSVAVTKEKFPRVQAWRGKRNSSSEYYGPYPSTGARELMDALLHVFPVRSCADGTFKTAQKSGRPCLLADIGKCSAPCVGRIDEEQHKGKVNELKSFLGGDQEDVLEGLKAQMLSAAESMDFEKAARLRDEVATLERTMSRQRTLLGSEFSADAVVFREDITTGKISVAQAQVRKGMIVDVSTWVTQKDYLLERDEQYQQILSGLYLQSTPPALVLLEETLDGMSAVEELLRTKTSGTRVRVAKSGESLDVLSAAMRNAESALKSELLKRSDSIEDRAKALEDIGEVTGTGLSPKRMECIDIAHISGTSAVASIVVFDNGAPLKSQYRRLNLPDSIGGDDLEGVRFAVNKRFTGSRAGMDTEPDLLIIDGGPAQVAAALEVMTNLGIKGVALAGLAKRLEEIWLPQDPNPAILSRSSNALFMLQRLRDEAHRTANSAHGRRRDAKNIKSALENVPGLGDKKRKLLLKTFGTVDAVRSASTIDLQAVRGIGPALAETIKENLNK